MGRPKKKRPSAHGSPAVTVAQVCSDYLLYAERAVAAGRMHPEYRQGLIRYLNAFCHYCGAVTAQELKRADVAAWVESQPTWRSPVTRRDVITMLLSAFHHAERELGVRNPLKGLKKPGHRPRLQSITPEEEQAIYRDAKTLLGKRSIWRQVELLAGVLKKRPVLTGKEAFAVIRSLAP